MRSSARPEVVRLDGVADVAAAIPHLLGFHPADSVVAVALREPRGRVGFTMRVDLPPPHADAAVAEDIAARMRHAAASSVLLALYTQRGADIRLPRAALVEAVEHRLDVPLRDAMLVDAGRVWSYLCTESACCPEDGRLLAPGSRGATAIAAAHALQGDVVLADREALVATTRPVGGVAARSMRQAQERAVARLVSSDPGTVDLQESLTVVDRVCRRYDDPPVELAHHEAADLVLRLHDIPLRDTLVQRLARDDRALLPLLRDLARLAQPPDDAPAATLLAIASYLRGDGVVAVAAAERALRTSPDYSLARLVRDAVRSQVDPQRVRQLCAQAPV